MKTKIFLSTSIKTPATRSDCVFVCVCVQVLVQVQVQVLVQVLVQVQVQVQVQVLVHGRERERGENKASKKDTCVSVALKFVVAAAVAVVTVRLMDSQPQGNVTCPLSCLNTIPHAHYSTKPCHHRFGRCVVGGDGWHCACLPGWTGLLCHVPYKKVQFRPTHTLLLLRWSNASPICSIFI